MSPLEAGHSRATAARSSDLPADRPASPASRTRAHDGVSRDVAADAPPSAELHAMLEPMLGAIVRMAGADAAAVRVAGVDESCAHPMVTVGIPGAASPAGASALAAWCNACAESRDARSECVRSDLCGHEERIPADVFGPVCKHIVAVPLRHRDRPVGTLNLMFEAERALPAAMTPLLQATGDLLGMTLDNARLARENLRISLTNERHLMANEVHDSLAQGLTYMRMRMSLLRDAIRGADEARALKFWSDVDDTLGNSHRRLRELITYFRSRMDPQGLVHALTETSDQFLDRTGIALEFVNRVARPVPAARARDRGLPHRAGGARQRLPPRAGPARDRDPHPRRRRLPGRGRGRRRRPARLPAGRGAGRVRPLRHRDHAGARPPPRRQVVLGAGARGTRLELHFPAAHVQDETAHE